MKQYVYIVSLGCPKNLVDSEVMLGLLEEANFVVSQDPEHADILLINTCGFIQPAVEEAIDEILLLSQFKEKNPSVKLIVTGCLVQRYGAELQKEFPEVDIFIGVNDFKDVVPLLDQKKTKTSNLALSPNIFLMDASLPRRISTPPHRAYLKISEGCSNKCSYCLIPSIRGPFRSRSMEDIVVEAVKLGQKGVRELTLVGQDVTAYGMDRTGKETDLVSLLVSLLGSCQSDWIRLLYLYPNRITDDLLRLMAHEDRLLNYLDIPLQHISSNILKSMNRPFKSSHVYSLIERIRKMLPEAAIRTTFIVGFPGETDNDVEELANFMTTYKLNNVGIFTYSNEEGCAAEHFENQWPEEIKQQRFDYLMEIQAEISLQKNKELVGRTLPVLVEGISSESDLLLEGRTPFQAPEIDGCVYITDGHCQAGDMVMVKITEAHPYDLVGEIIAPESAT